MMGQKGQLNVATGPLLTALLIVAVGLSACGQSTSEPVENLTVGVFIRSVFIPNLYSRKSRLFS